MEILFSRLNFNHLLSVVRGLLSVFTNTYIHILFFVRLNCIFVFHSKQVWTEL